MPGMGVTDAGYGGAAYLGVHPLDVRLQVALLGEGGRAQHAQVGLLPRVSHHVGLQHHLLVERLTAVCAFVGSFT